MLSRPDAGLAGVLLALALLTGSAAADTWAVAPEESRVVFGYETNGRPREGHFERFEGEGQFDPADPGAATLEVRIATDSIELGDQVESDFAKSPEYFNAEEYPFVVYRLQKLTPEDDGRYRAEGELTIRNHTRPVVTTIRLEIEGDRARAEGALTVSRKEFHFGVGPSSIFLDLGPEISVRFELTARPVQ